MSRIGRKLKKTNKALRFIYYAVIVLYIISLFFFIKNLLTIRKTEPVLITTFIIFFILYLLFYSFGNLINLIEKKNKPIFITSLIAIIFVFVFSFGSYYIKFIYSGVHNITDDESLIYRSYLITLKDSEFANDMKIGIISEDYDANARNLAKKLYTNEKLSNELVDYSSYESMLDDLYNSKVGAILVPGNYISIFNQADYEDVFVKTKVISDYQEKQNNEDMLISSNKDFSDPLTFLLLGVDSEKNGLNESTSFNGDTMMIVTFNPKTLEAVMVSVPRDTFVPIACRNNNYAKINSSAANSTKCAIDTLENFLDIDIDYYVKINFKGIVDLVDAIGGIEVDVEKPFYDKYNGKVCEQNSNRLFGDNLVCMQPGLQTLDGEQALAYARNRHLYVGQDLDRIRHQQQVVEAISSKALKFSSIKDFQKIITAISNNIATNMDTDTILSGYQVIKTVIGNMLTGDSGLNINKAYLETYSLNVYLPTSGRTTSALGYYNSSLDEIKKALKVSLGEDEDEEIKTFSFSMNKPYEKRIIGKGKKKNPSSSVLPNFVGKKLDEAKEFCNNNNIEIKVKYVDSGEHYNDKVLPGLIGDQSVHANTLVSTIDELIVYISD